MIKMFNSLVKVVLIGLLSMLAVGSLSAQTLKVVDAYHYIKKQIKPIANTILSFFNTTFEEVIDGTKQTSLFSFK